MDTDAGITNRQATFPFFPLLANQPHATAHALGQTVVVPSGFHGIGVSLKVGHGHKGSALCGRQSTHLVGRIAAVVVWASAATVDVVTRIPSTIAAIDDFGDFIAVPWAVFRQVQIARAWAERNTLGVAESIGEYALVETGWRVVASGCIPIAVHTQELATQFGWALWAGTVVVVADGDVQEAVRAETQTSTVVRARSTEWVVGFHGLVAQVVDDLHNIENRIQPWIDFHPHHDVVVSAVSAVAAFGAGVQVDVAVFCKIRVNGYALNTRLSVAKQVAFDCWESGTAAYTKQFIDAARGQAYGQAFAFFSEKHRVVWQESHVPRVFACLENFCRNGQRHCGGCSHQRRCC